MLKNGFTLIAAVLLGVFLFTDNAASVPLTFSHQGRLMNGNIPADGFFDITYRFYDAPTGGNLEWSETHNGVKVTNGLFTVVLGETSSFFDVFERVKFGIFIEIQIGGEVLPISPRTKLSGAPYAILADGVSSSNPIPGSLDTAKIDLSTSSTGSSLRLRVVPTAQTTGRGVAMKATQQGGEIAIGDPDFDLLRITGGASGANFSMTGDPDFDLLRMSANADSAVIAMNGQSIGDPDFDLLRIVAGKGNGDGGSIAVTGDPDFDLLRMSANADTAKITMSGQVIGDPDFDLLTIEGTPVRAIMKMQIKNSNGNVHGIMTEVDSQSTRSYHYYLWSSSKAYRMIEISSDSVEGKIKVSNADTSKGLVMRADSGGGSIVIDEEGHQKIRLDTDSGSSNIAVNEEGTHNITISSDSGSSSIAVNEEGTHNITIRVDSSGGSFAINEPGVGKKVSLDSDGDGYLSNSLKIGTTIGTNHIEVVGGANCNGFTWNNASDANSKENFQPVDGEDILDRIAELDITRWNYKGESEAEHIGPTAQDFYKAFGVGGDDKTISTIDPSGIALAAIKELYKKSKEVDELKVHLDELARQVEKMARERKQN